MGDSGKMSNIFCRTSPPPLKRTGLLTLGDLTHFLTTLPPLFSFSWHVAVLGWAGMNPKIISTLLIASGLVCASGLRAGEGPAPSPGCTIKQHVGTTDIEIVYSRPGVKGRKIFGDLVPYGQVWRTGANAVTKITFDKPVKFEGTEVPAGAYGLFTIPGEKEWTVIIYKDPSISPFDYKEADDFARVKVTPKNLTEPVETFTIGVNDIRDDSATLNFIWDKTRVPVKLSVK